MFRRVFRTMLLCSAIASVGLPALSHAQPPFLHKPLPERLDAGAPAFAQNTSLSDRKKRELESAVGRMPSSDRVALGLFVDAIERSSPDAPVATFTTLGKIVLSGKWDSRLPTFLEPVISRTESAYYFMVCVYALLQNPHFNASVFTDSLFMRLASILEKIEKAPLDGERISPAIEVAYALRNTPVLSARFLDVLDFFAGISDARRSEALSDIGVMYRFSDATKRRFLDRILDNYARAGLLLGELGVQPGNPVLHANVAYAIGAIGEERTRTLYTALGISYFARYSPAVLEAAYANLFDTGFSEKRILVSVFNKNDSNGAFYREGGELDALLGPYKVIIMEGSEDTVMFRICDISAVHGTVHSVVFGGHGSEDGSSFLLGDDVAGGAIDTGDYLITHFVRGCLSRNPEVVLIACNSGAEGGVADFFRSEWGARVFAPTLSSYKTTIYTSERGIEQVTYRY